MKEIEVKFRVADLGAPRKKLKALGWRCVWKGNEENYFFGTPSRVFRRAGSNLRLRRWNGHSVSITFKTKPKTAGKRYKVRNEYQIMADSLPAARSLLIALGYTEIFRYKKYREHWKLRGASIELDRVMGVLFVEVEGSRKIIEKYAHLLDLDWARSTTKGYLTLLREMKSR